MILEIAAVGIIVAIGITLIGRWDESLPLKAGSVMWILAGAAAESVCIMMVVKGGSVCEKFLWAVFGGSLLLASLTDSLLCQVYNFTWWISLAAVFGLFCCRLDMLMENDFPFLDALGEMMLFGGLQLLLRGRIYGCADSYAFCVCALSEMTLGISGPGFLTHMLFAYFLLFPVQVMRRNIDCKGNLRKPVPFLPYITAAFWITLVLYGLWC